MPLGPKVAPPQGHIGLYNKWNEAYNSILGWGQEVNLFSILKVVMLHVKLTGIKQKTQCKPVLCHIIHPRPPGGVKRSKLFSEGHVAIKEKK